MMKRTFNHTAAAYRNDTNGNVAMMFAASLFIIIGLLAVAVDLSNGFSAKQRLQDTTDAVALLAAKDKTLDTPAKLEAAAQALYDVTYPGERGVRIEIEDMHRDGDKVTVVTKNNIDTYFSGVFNTSNMDVGVTSTAVYATKAMDVALVLDTTFSMSENNKIGGLKVAANNLLNTFDELENDNLRVSVVPFAQYVNVGLSRRNKVWLDVPADSTTYGDEVCRMKRDVISRSNCRRISRTCSNDGVSYDCSYTRCDKQYGPEYEVCNSPVSRQTWKGCVGSRVAGYDERVAYDGRKIPGLLNTNCGVELQELSNDMTKAKSTVSSMTAAWNNGDTYIPSGVLWGWRTLDGSLPLSSTGTTGRDKVMIVMTDGKNEGSKNGTKHNGSSQNAANAKTDATCEAAKRDDVTIYTIAYDVNDTTTKNMLTRCASGSANFFDAANASELNKAFQTIGDALNELRIAS
ncbi:MAG: pilus assembly protein [Litorimonas sp.]